MSADFKFRPLPVASPRRGWSLLGVPLPCCCTRRRQHAASGSTEATGRDSPTVPIAHVVASANYEAFWHPEGVRGVLPGVSGSPRHTRQNRQD